MVRRDESTVNHDLSRCLGRDDARINQRHDVIRIRLEPIGTLLCGLRNDGKEGDRNVFLGKEAGNSTIDRLKMAGLEVLYLICPELIIGRTGIQS